MASRGYGMGGGGGRGRPPSPPPPRHLHMRHPPPTAMRPSFLDGPLPPLRILEEQLHLQHQELQSLLVDNQRLAATHVALKQELHATHHDLQRASHAAKLSHVEDDAHIRDVYEKSAKMEMDLRAAEAQREELLRIRADIQKLSVVRQELSGQVQSLSQDLARAASELQQVPAIKAEIETMKQELTRARTAVEHEKRARAETFEQGQMMEKNLFSMAREVEKLRTELVNIEKISQANTAVAGNPGVAYGGNFGSQDPGHGGNSLSAAYGVNVGQGPADAGGQYGSGHGSWNAYDMQRAYGRR